MARQRVGYALKREYKDKSGRKRVFWYGRVTFVDDDGRRRNIKRRADPNTKTEAREVCKAIIRELDERGQRGFDASRMTVADLCAYYDEHYLVEATYREGRKISGLRSLATPKGFLRTIKDRLGRKRLRALTYADLREFRAKRLAAPTRGDVARQNEETEAARAAGAPKGFKAELRCTRSIASVNRELALLRRMLNVAVRERWIPANPFGAGEPLISLADEHQRERILTPAEEKALLGACTGRREHLRPIIIAALDSACRFGELIKLQWADVDLDSGVLTLLATNTKTQRARQVVITRRLRAELEALREKSDGNPDTRVFGIVSNVKRSFKAIREATGLEGFRFHDARHTAASRLINRNIPLAQVGKQLGHTQPQTTWRYVNPSIEMIQANAAALDEFNAEAEKAEENASARVEEKPAEQLSEMVN